MKKLILVLIGSLLVSACATKYTITTTLPDGTQVEQEVSESMAIAMQASESMKALGAPVDPCAASANINVSELSEAGERAYYRALEMCQVRAMVAQAMGQPATAHGQIAQQNAKAIAAIEAADAAKVSSWTRLGGIAVGGYFASDVLSSAFAAAGSNYAFGDINMSNSGDVAGGAGHGVGEGVTPGGSGAGGDRAMTLNIGEGNHLNTTLGDSNTNAQAREKAVGMDNPTAYSNGINYGDNDDVQGELGLIP